MASKVAASNPSSRWLAGAGTTANGIPVASVASERLRPCLRRSTGLGPATWPPQGALVMPPSTASCSKPGCRGPLRTCPPSAYSLPMAEGESAQARGDELVPGGHLRATHEDRNRVVEVLRVAAGDGRLTLEELDQRVGAALTARTYGELAALVSDLPAASESPAGASEVTPKDVVRIDCHSATTRRDGPWMVPRRMQVRVTGGSVTLDFTKAVTWWPSLQLDVEVRAGSLRLVTRPGMVVSTDDLVVRASSVKVRAPWGPGVPVRFRIDVAGTVASGGFKARPPRRSLWQWLRRRPLPAALPPGRT